MITPSPNMKHRRSLKFFIIVPLAVLAFVTAFSAIVMWLWNAILPAVTGVHTITFWQAAGILILAKILFGGFWGGRRGGRPPWRRHMIDRERWRALTPEQREQMREEMRRRFGDWPAPECCPWEEREGSSGEKPATG